MDNFKDMLSVQNKNVFARCFRRETLTIPEVTA